MVPPLIRPCNLIRQPPIVALLLPTQQRVLGRRLLALQIDDLLESENDDVRGAVDAVQGVG